MQKSLRVNFLDGIRGWASLVVLIGHLMYVAILTTPILEFNKERLLTDISSYDFLGFVSFFIVRFLTDGHLAVLIFFVLSGYALSLSHLNFKKRDIPLATASRYFRLMIPVLFTTFVIYLLLKLNLFFNLDVLIPEGTSGLLHTIYTFDANIFNFFKFSLFDVWTNHKDISSYNIVLWTMKVELIGSLLIYGYLFIFRRSENPRWFIATIVTAILFIIRPFYAAFMMGYLLAELNKKFSMDKINMAINPISFKYLIAFIFLVTVMSSALYRGSDHLTLLYASLIVYSVSYSANLITFFSNKISHFLGLISFPLYLVQIPIICSWSSYLYLQLSLLKFDPILSMIINLTSTLLLCILASRLLLPVENIAIKYSKIIGKLLIFRNSSYIKSQV